MDDSSSKPAVTRLPLEPGLAETKARAHRSRLFLDSSVWDDPDALARFVRLALGQGIVEPLEEAIWRLVEIDHSPERSQLLLALRLAKQGRHGESLRQMEEAASRLARAVRMAVRREAARLPYKVWLLSDDRGSWASLLEGPAPAFPRWSYMELVGSFPTRQAALRALRDLQRQLRVAGRDRRRLADRRRAARPFTAGDRRTAAADE